MAVTVTKRPTKKRAKTEKVEPEGFSQEQMAKIVGCAQSTISRGIKRGDIDTLPNGRLPASAEEQIRQLWHEDQKLEEENAALERRLKIAETDKSEAVAELQKLKLSVQSGKYIELELVKRDGEDTGERMLAVLRSIAQRVALSLECKCRSAAVVEAAIADEVERVVGELRESKFSGVE